jgi:hypothetical protein
MFGGAGAGWEYAVLGMTTGAGAGPIGEVAL